MAKSEKNVIAEPEQKARAIAGNSVRKFDQANRVNIPVDYRIGFSSRLYLVLATNEAHPEKTCLILYSDEEYQEFYRKAEESVPPEVRQDIRRMLSSNSQPVFIDRDGRICIDPEMKQKAYLSDEALIATYPKYIEIWNPERYNAICGKFQNSVTASDGKKYSVADLLL